MAGSISREDLETILRNANIYLRRGDFAAAKKTCESALASEPKSVELTELLGDILLAEGKRSEAMDTYKRAMELDPKAAGPELKYARLVLNLSEEAREVEDLQKNLDAPSVKLAEKKNPMMAMLASLFWPGLGQWYNGDNTKAIILAVVAGVTVLGLLVTGDLGRMLNLLVASFLPGQVPASALQPPGVLANLLWGGGAIAWIYGVIDAPFRASALSKSRKGA